MPDMFSIIGAMLIGFVVLSSGAKKVIDGLPNDHTIKTKYLSRCYSFEETSSIWKYIFDWRMWWEINFNRIHISYLRQLLWWPFFQNLSNPSEICFPRLRWKQPNLSSVCPRPEVMLKFSTVKFIHLSLTLCLPWYFFRRSLHPAFAIDPLL